MTENTNFFRASATDFKKIPGNSIVYWMSKRIKDIFNVCTPLSQFADIGKGLDTGDNHRFLRLWFETQKNTEKWVSCQKGGPFRKWYGNNDFVINWANNGQELRNFSGSHLRNSHNYFHSGLSWTRNSSTSTAFRFFPEGYIFESAGPCLFSKNTSLYGLAGFLNSKLTMTVLKFMAPTLGFQNVSISTLPILEFDWNDPIVVEASKKCINICTSDWNSYETSLGFANLTLLSPDYHHLDIHDTYTKLRTSWKEITLETQHFEEENNRIFIEAYGLQDELTPEVPIKEITLTCNPQYRYGGNKSEEELEALLLADTMKEFISYAVGCMFGRYSLDAPGLILANQGEGLEDYYRTVKEKGVRGQGLGASENQNHSNPSPLTPNPSFTTSFEPDADNVIPILDDNWFTDDIAERFQRFLRVTFSDEHYEANLKFIEKAIGKNIRKFFLKDFYTDHVKRYKKRPIYWLFSSPKGNFNALIYMHRYRPDTVSVILNDYLREFRTKLIARKEHLEKVSISATADNREKTTALKEIEKLTKIIDELNAYENDILYPLATQNIEIDLDDGVKTNYPKFGKALKKIPGLS